MGLQDAIEAIPRKTMVLFFLIDTSGSMAGSKIGAVNAAIAEVIPELQDISQANADALIKVAALEFSYGVKWLTPEPLDVDLFQWNNINAAGETDLGAACIELNGKLSTKAFMREATGSFAPALFLISDGGPTDDFDAGLAELQKNNWYRQAIRVAIAIGDDADRGVLAKFTGSTETVLEVHNAAALKKLIKFVSVRASKIASQSVQASTVLHPVKTAGTYAGLEAAAQTVPAESNAAPAVPVTEKQEELAKQIEEVKVDISDEEEW
ncbi:MAG: VWA domain-containing protein [Spirochaetaceae bacterium]|jgi:uncharacterized protein YegL|nr:VWA domain-containing protein [Spirochaetaceae bacterium]